MCMYIVQYSISTVQNIFKIKIKNQRRVGFSKTLPLNAETDLTKFDLGNNNKVKVLPLYPKPQLGSYREGPWALLLVGVKPTSPLRITEF